MDIINYIRLVKNGDKQIVKELLVNGFNQYLINDLVNLPAVSLNEIKDCFSISIDGEKLSRKIKHIKLQVESENRINELINMGLSYKQANKFLGIFKNEFSHRRTMFGLDFNDNKLRTPDIEFIYTTFHQKKRQKDLEHLELLRETHLDVVKKKGLSVSLKKIDEICCEYD
jgi:predicted aspartyl protease